jgi:hypothetical protein
MGATIRTPLQQHRAGVNLRLVVLDRHRRGGFEQLERRKLERRPGIDRRNRGRRPRESSAAVDLRLGQPGAALHHRAGLGRDLGDDGRSTERRSRRLRVIDEGRGGLPFARPEVAAVRPRR